MVIIFLFLASINLYAQSIGQITVLEAPIFESENIDSKIIQYHYKGDQIYIHPRHTRNNRLKNKVNISNEKLQASQNQYLKDFKDPLFDYNIEEVENSDFYKTLDSNGKDAYILKEHVYIFYNDLRELDQNEKEFDPTNYKLNEPLPKNYPLIKEIKSRGISSIAFRSALRPNYPFPKTITDQAIGLETEFNFIWTNHVSWNQDYRLFFGGNIFISSSENAFIIETASATERLFKIAVGPYICYDIWRNNEYRFNIFSALTLGLFNSKSINVNSDQSSSSINIEYGTNDLELRFGSNFQIQDVLSTADFLFGFNTFFQLPHSYDLRSRSGNINDFSSSYFTKSFTESFQVGINFFIGLQSDF